LKARGVSYEGPNPGARSRPDGVELEWRTAQPAGTDGHGLPFLIDDVTERALRVPSGEAARHPNGVSGIAELNILVADLDSAGEAYARLLDAQVDGPVDSELAGEETRSVSLITGRHAIQLHQPVAAGALTSRLERLGDGPFSVRFRAAEPLEADPQSIDGARISATVG
jgi:hypothetical protein